MGLRPYQINGIDKLATKFAKGLKKLLYQLATGGGKTYMFAGLIARYLVKQQRRVLIVVHREELLVQAYKTLIHGFDITAAPVTADTKYLPNVMVYVAMVETANNRLKKNPNYFGSIGLLIVDEAHIGNHKKIYEYFQESLIIGFTATPLAATKKDPLNNYFEDIVCGVDIPELIAMWREDNTVGLVPNMTYHISNINRKELSVKGDDFDEVMMSQKFSTTKHVQNCVKAYQDLCKGEKTIIFNVNIEHSKKVRDAFLAFGYNCRHIDGETDKAIRKETLKWFKTTPGAILMNVGVYVAGFDEPSVINVMTNFSTMSLSKWLQTTGRGARPFPGKTFFRIIDLGGNAYCHGDWSEPRNWTDIFRNPPKPKADGEAPIKACMGCGVMVHASVKVCPHCGHEFVKVIQYDEGAVIWELLSKDNPVKIDVQGIINEIAAKVKDDGTPYNSIAGVHKIKELVLRHVKYIWRIGKVDDATASRIIEIFQHHVKEWCRLQDRKYNMWFHQSTKEWMLTELERIYKYKPEKKNLVPKY